MINDDDFEPWFGDNLEPRRTIFLKKFLKPHTNNTGYRATDAGIKVAERYIKNFSFPDTIISNNHLCWYSHIKSLTYLIDGEDVELKIQNTKNQLENSPNRYFVIFLYLCSPNIETLSIHANTLIFDRQLKIIEKFEPHGKSDKDKYSSDKCDEAIIEMFPDYKIQLLYPKSPGIQWIENHEPINTKHYKTDPNGFCFIWNIWYLEFRFTIKSTRYSNIELLEIYTKILDSIKYVKNKDNIRIRNFIRNYSHHIMENSNLSK